MIFQKFMLNRLDYLSKPLVCGEKKNIMFDIIWHGHQCFTICFEYILLVFVFSSILSWLYFSHQHYSSIYVLYYWSTFKKKNSFQYPDFELHLKTIGYTCITGEYWSHDIGDRYMVELIWWSKVYHVRLFEKGQYKDEIYVTNKHHVIQVRIGPPYPLLCPFCVVRA